MPNCTTGPCECAYLTFGLVTYYRSLPSMPPDVFTAPCTSACHCAAGYAWGYLAWQRLSDRQEAWRREKQAQSPRNAQKMPSKAKMIFSTPMWDHVTCFLWLVRIIRAKKSDNEVFKRAPYSNGSTE
jgi:hypothetical protein